MPAGAFDLTTYVRGVRLGPAPQVFVLRKLLAEKVNYTTPADYSFTPAGGTQQRLDRLVAGWVRRPAS